MRWIRSVSGGIAGSLALAAAAFFTVIWFAPLDFDAMHDGTMIATAIGFRDGLNVHGEVFSQYGPVTAWVQGAWLKLGWPPALGLRILNVIWISATVFFVADLGRRRPTGFPVTLGVGRFAAVIWIITADVFLGAAMFPWSSVLSAMLLAASLWLLVRAVARMQVMGLVDPAAAVQIAISGALMGAMPFVRINNGLLGYVSLTLAGAILLVLGWRRHWVRRSAVMFAVGIASGFALVAMILLMTDSVRPYYRQSIRWALSSGDEMTAAKDPFEKAFEILMAQSVPVVLAVCVIALGAIGAKAHEVFLRRVLQSLALALAGLLGLIASGFAPTWLNSGKITWPAPNASALDFLLALQIFVLALALPVIIYRIVFKQDRSHLMFGLLILWAFAAANAGQTYPLLEMRHIWWGLPISLVLIVGIINRFAPLRSFSRNPLLIWSILVAVSSAHLAYQTLRMERVGVQDVAILNGMRLVPEEALAIEQDFHLLEENIGNEPALFFTWFPHYSVLRGNLQSQDPYFVRWGFPVDPLEARIAEGNKIVVQFFPDPSNEILKSFAPGYRVLGRTDRLAVIDY